MPSFDSIVVGEDWISEHFFTTDSTKESFQSEVIKLRKLWDEQAKEGHPTTLARFSEIRGRLQVMLAGLSEEPAGAEAAYGVLREALGFKGTTAEVTFQRSGTDILVPGVWSTAKSDVLFLEAEPADAAEDILSTVLPLGAVLLDGKVPDPRLTVAKAVSEMYLSDCAPQYVVVMAGRWLLLTEQERWAEGRYLAADVLLIADRNDGKKYGEIDRFLAIFGRESLMPAADESIWWNGVLEASIKHTVGVSKDLREGIRRSIEIIANDVLKRRAARGLSTDDVDGQDLARQSLRFLYRILFLLYAEASPEMGVLPVGAGEYNDGYGLDRLRELTLVNIQSPEAQRGTHVYESLERLFRLVDGGHNPGTSSSEEPSGRNEGLVFQSLKADLFRRETTTLIDDAELSNSELQRVLQHLLLSKEVKGKDRGFISYAELGINQLGAVYEGLMSYTGFIASEPLHEVAKDGNPEKGSWVAPVDRSESIDAKHFVRYEDERTGEKKPILHEAGSFVFRLAGRERQQSASYYTPEVLTRFVVSQALEELLDQDGTVTPADNILNLAVCEPALGSGAFAIEAVRQLADQYLKRKQKELDIQIPADEYPRELQKIKAHIALHQVHGVDLNSTAVELAEVSLWLDTMVKDLQAPWFGLRLRRGNSLIGARRATYSRQALNDKSWLKSEPQEAPLTGLVSAMAEDSDDPNVLSRIHHFLLPAEGWGAAADAKEVKDLVGEAQKDLKGWRSRIRSKPSKAQVDRLIALGRRAESLWKISLRRLQIAEAEARRDIDYFGKPKNDESSVPAVTREQIERTLGDPNGAYQRLRRVMDAWNALWFWPLTERSTAGSQPPTLEQWIAALEGILGLDGSVGKTSRKYGLVEGQTTVLSMASWGELESIESFDLSMSQVRPVFDVMAANPWLEVCERVATDQGFFHWELDFATVFGRGGFDLQVGNPPWVRPRSDEAALLAEGDPWWQLSEKTTQSVVTERRRATLSEPQFRSYFVEAACSPYILSQYLSSKEYSLLSGLQPDLYRCFMVQTWRSLSSIGISGLIHLESHFTDEKGGPLRAETYGRLRRHWQFINELKLFEIQDQKRYGVNIYGNQNRRVAFQQAAGLYHPDTVVRSISHDGTGQEPGFKNPEGSWDLRPHRSRIVPVNDDVLRTWSDLLEEEGQPASQTRMLYTINRSSESVLEKLTGSRRIGSLGLEFSRGWDESIDRAKGIVDIGWGAPDDWNDVILQGPHLYLNLPAYKRPNETMLHHLDWTNIDLTVLDSDHIPVTSFKRSCPMDEFQKLYSKWTGGVSAQNRYRVAWRKMAANTGARTLIPALIPPGSTHTHGISSVGFADESRVEDLVSVCGVMGSFVADFMVRSAPKSNITPSSVYRLPFPSEAALRHIGPLLNLRVLRLNAISAAYRELWERAFDSRFADDRWAPNSAHFQLTDIQEVTEKWSGETPLRRAGDRRQASLEIDVLVALALNITVDELSTLYRTQFAVQFGYDRKEDYFDATGALVPRSAKTLNVTGSDAKTDVATVDREEDMRKAYAHFEQVLAKKQALEPVT